jgi:hypothetical protein
MKLFWRPKKGLIFSREDSFLWEKHHIKKLQNFSSMYQIISDLVFIGTKSYCTKPRQSENHHRRNFFASVCDMWIRSPLTISLKWISDTGLAKDELLDLCNNQNVFWLWINETGLILMQSWWGISQSNYASLSTFSPISHNLPLWI